MIYQAEAYDFITLTQNTAYKTREFLLRCCWRIKSSGLTSQKSGI